ncbi:hypothetical protein HYDPIDRAFT_171800 [Hydnomerulius pinastri MD-312]|nr:hypothetical protein HYDPIDRAFT_171800 [Hydnomerulius pinastri MD-312]
MPPLPSNAPLHNSHFNLDASGVAGFFGGDEAISAMATVHLYRGRRWLGWYNSPGSYTVAKRYGQLAKSRFWDGVFPGVNEEPATTFGLDGKEGPKYIASYSGTVIERTGHIAYLLDNQTKEVEKVKVESRESSGTPMSVTVVRLENIAFADQLDVPMMSADHALFACIPIIISVSACVACATVDDWYSFAMILLGIIANGLSCFVIGSAKLVLKMPRPAEGVPPGDGILLKGNSIVVLKGAEKDVNAITKGHFVLKMKGGPEYRAVGLCSVLLVAQFVLQLLLIPQATLFGQVMFVSSLAASWIYTLFLSSLEKEKLQAERLHATLERPVMKKFRLGSRTAGAVFAALVLSERTPNSPHSPDSRKILDSILSNDTPMWREWKSKVLRELGIAGVKKFDSPGCDSSVEEGDRPLLRTLLHDAQQAYDGYRKFCSPIAKRSRVLGTAQSPVNLNSSGGGDVDLQHVQQSLQA